ncbi:MAG: flagellar hook-basal body complex protein FliE [Planctomycetes bacterium]|nr:flagellar hook-basal body complex protein FliE [Planctomycetota bacterium]
MTGSSPVDPFRSTPVSDSSLTRKSSRSDASDGPSFAEILKDSIREVNELKKEADDAIQGLALGKTENVSEVLTAVEKADLAFRALMSIRNKLVDAYEEINRLRV